MGSAPWIDAVSWRVIESAKYDAHEPFTITRGQRTLTGTVEFGHVGGRPVLYVKDAAGDEQAIPLDGKTTIDGVAAKEWRE